MNSWIMLNSFYLIYLINYVDCCSCAIGSTNSSPTLSLQTRSFGCSIDWLFIMTAFESWRHLIGCVLSQTLLCELLRSCDHSIRAPLVELAAECEARLSSGEAQHPIFHLEALAARFLVLYKHFIDQALDQLGPLWDCKPGISRWYYYCSSTVFIFYSYDWKYVVLYFLLIYIVNVLSLSKPPKHGLFVGQQYIICQ